MGRYKAEYAARVSKSHSAEAAEAVWLRGVSSQVTGTHSPLEVRRVRGVDVPRPPRVHVAHNQQRHRLRRRVARRRGREGGRGGKRWAKNVDDDVANSEALDGVVRLMRAFLRVFLREFAYLRRDAVEAAWDTRTKRSGNSHVTVM